MSVCDDINANGLSFEMNFTLLPPPPPPPPHPLDWHEEEKESLVTR